MSRVQLVHVSKQFGAHLAVHDLNLDIRSGEFISIVGGSGCGKTTTLRMIAGFESPTSGDILLDGTRVNEVPVQDRGVGVVFQSYALFPTMTVSQNIGFGLEMARQPPSTRQTRVSEMLNLVHLTEHADKYPWQLSGGQQQRVALARALALAPKVLLLDEPLSALDARIRLSLRAEIRRIQQELGITAIYVTHDQEEALTIADRIVVMEQGVAMQTDSARAVYDRPNSPFVARFVGLSNLFEGIWQPDGTVLVDNRRWRLPVAGVDGQRVLLTVRPERMKLHAGEGLDPAHNVFTAHMGVPTFLGSSWRVEVWKGAQRILVDVGRDQERILERLPMGSPVVVSFHPQDAVYFEHT